MRDDTHNRNRGLLAHHVALEGAALAIELAAGISAPLKSLADQVIRSAASVPATPAVSSRANASLSRSEDGCGSRLIAVRHKPPCGAVTSQRVQGDRGVIASTIGESHMDQLLRSDHTLSCCFGWGPLMLVGLGKSCNNETHALC